MDLSQAVKFIPKTNTVNKDRSYAVLDDLFIKYDTDVTRGTNEANMLRAVEGCPGVQEYINSFINENCHVLITRLVKGETLENSKLDFASKVDIFDSLSATVTATIQLYNVTHGDINESNVIYNPLTNDVTLIDWETGEVGRSNKDMLGLKYILGYLFDNR